MIRKYFFSALLVAVVLSSCKSYKTTKELPVSEIPVTSVIKKDVPIFREFVGQVYGEKDIPIRARIEGFLEGIHFKEGFDVEKGQLLYSIDPKPFESRVNAQQSKVAEAQTALTKADNDLKRIEPLAKANAVSQRDLDAAIASKEAAVAGLAAARANLKSAQIELGYTKIYSPINGIIGKTQAKVGDFVGREPNPVILNTTSKTDNVKVQFFITEKEYLALFREFEQEQSDNVRNNESGRLELMLSDGTLYEEKGTVDFVDRGVDATTGSMLVQADFPNPRGLLRPGLYGRVRVEFDIAEGALLIPQRCVVELQGKYSVFVVDGENKIESRQVDLSDRLGDLWLVREGLKGDEKLVIDALQRVRTGMIISPQETEFKSKSELK